MVVGASLFIAACARVSVPLPFTPVYLTLANFAVLAVGLTLGAKRGFAAAALYLAQGALGFQSLPRAVPAESRNCSAPRADTSSPTRLLPLSPASLPSVRRNRLA